MRSSHVLALGMLVAAAAGCKNSAVQEAAPTPSASAVAAAPSASADPSEEVAAPPPVVAADPNIPLNEAVVGPATVPADYSADTAPPPPATEDQPAMPETGDVWVPGYWWWSIPLHKYAWVSGAWRVPPPSQVWTPGMWTSAPSGRFVWVPGFWAAPGTTAPAAIAIAPPAPVPDPPPPSPGIGFVWTPGYHAYREGRYAWVGGSWARPPHDGLGWVEPRYVNTGGHYYFQPGRWDEPIAHRGVVYQPDLNVRPGARFRPVPAPVGLVAAHAGFNTAAAHAITWGGTRTPTGGFVYRRPVYEPHGAYAQGGANDTHTTPPSESEHGATPSEGHGATPSEGRGATPSEGRGAPPSAGAPHANGNGVGTGSPHGGGSGPSPQGSGHHH